MSNHLTPVKDDVADRPHAPERVCYEAHWCDRSVFISAPCQSAREWQWHCLASAILLERLEDACVLAETILESSLQFFVSELPAECNSSEGQGIDGQGRAYMRVLLNCSSDEVEIWLPAGAYSNMVRHGELIESSNVRWSCVTASIKIAHVVLEKSDVARLQPKALMLIPASWQQQWLCTVDVPQFDRSIAAIINPISDTIELNYAGDTERIWTEKKPGQSVVSAYLDQTIELNPSSLLLGTQSKKDVSSTHSISVSMAQASCHCTINEDRFTADLAKIGEGFGLCIREYS